ncbi:MAG: methylmalonyl Co-A mutase-associated GTPase MeaB [Clostridia bacterium]
MRSSNFEIMIADIRAAKPAALARAISLVEDEEPAGVDVLEAVHPHTGNSHVVGITGPPGSGKSTLTDRLVKRLREAGNSVGVIAVDPTSPFSGGALLGDRTRMTDLATDPDVFIRSMGTRGSLGGLSRAVYGAIKILEAARKDVILVETVGVGQSEVDIARVADTVVVVFVPGLGDDVQAIKAGITEIGDLLVVNKSDLPGASRVESVLESTLNLAPPREEPAPKILTTSAQEDRGVEDLLNMIAEHRRLSTESGLLYRRRRMRARAEVIAILARRVSRRTEALLSEGENGWYEDLTAGDVTPGRLAEKLWRRIICEEREEIEHGNQG